MTSQLQIRREFNNTVGSGFRDHLSVRAIEETLKLNQPTLGHQKSSPPCPNVEQIWDSRV